MSRRLRRRYEAEMANQPLEIKNLLPLMDVVFALLTFFVLSAMQKTPARATISINEKTEIFLNKQKIGIAEVSDRVKQLLEPNQDLVVVLNADRSVQHGDVVQIMDQLRQIPRVKMAIATKNN